MFRLNLILRRKSDDIMIFSPAPWFRIIFLFLAGIIVTGIFTIVSDGESRGFVVPVIIAAACSLAALYEESWSFDRSRRIIISKSGLVFLNKTRTWSFAEIENFELNIFLRGVESDGSADHEINLTKPFSMENTEDVAGKGSRIIHKKYHQELRLNFKAGERITIESLDSRGTEALNKKAMILSDFSGIRLER